MNFDYRKHLVEYDDVLAKQREIVYEERNAILRGDDVRDTMMGLIESEIADLVDSFCGADHSDEWDVTSLFNAIRTIMPVPDDLTPEAMESLSQDELSDYLIDVAHAQYEEREASLGEEIVRAWERRVLLVTLSGLWINHVDAMDELREAAMLQAFGQQDPLVAYKRQGFDAYQQFRGIFQKNVVYQIYHILWQPTAGLILQENEPAGQQAPAGSDGSKTDGHSPNGREAERTARQAAVHSKRQRGREKVGVGGKLGRNDPCYCGSGKKFKFCHGR
jgi:preprotein translocase subunit SecA